VLSGTASPLTQIVVGVATGLQFSPIAAAVTCVLAAGVSGYPSAPRSRLWWSAAIVLAGWAAGDGVRIAGSSAGPTVLAAWAVSGLALGYVAPTWLGAYVGRLVHRGTGWLSAGAVALTLVPALSLLGDAISGGLWRLVR
jgi:hypothetical protein